MQFIDFFFSDYQLIYILFELLIGANINYFDCLYIDDNPDNALFTDPPVLHVTLSASIRVCRV